MKTHPKNDPKMEPKSIKNHSKNRCEKRDEKRMSKTLEPGMAKCASSPNPIISKGILRSEVRRKQTKKADWKVSTEWSAKSGVQRESEERQVQTSAERQRADREPTTHPNTLGGQRPRADLIQVPAAKFRTWSQRGVSTDGGSYDAGACGKCSNIYFFTKMVSNISKRWNQIEQKQDFWRSLTFEGSQKGAKGRQKGAQREPKGSQRSRKSSSFFH